MCVVLSLWTCYYIGQVLSARSLEFDSLARLRHLPFVRGLKYKPTQEGRHQGFDGQLDITTPQGRFRLLVETKRSHLSHTAVPPLTLWLNRLQTDRTQAVILLARYIPRKTAEALIEAKVNFADDAGNIHLTLGDAYNWTVIGIPAPEPISERRPAS